MNLSQMHLAVKLFCKKFKGIHLKDIENIPNDFVIDIIEDDMVVYWLTFVMEFKELKRNIYETKESFLKDFEITLEDIV